MSATGMRKTSTAQRVYGDLVYWVTIASALLCMIGPVVAMVDRDSNVLNPHYLFANIFKGEKPASVWALSATEEVRLGVRWRSTDAEREEDRIGARDAVALLRGLPAPEAGRPPSEMSVGDRLTIARLPESEVLDGLEYVRLDQGGKLTFAEAREAVLAVYGGEVFSNGHFWMDSLGSGDGLTQFGLALGCSVALWALLAVAFVHLRQRVFVYFILSLWVAALVFLSAAGLIESH